MLIRLQSGDYINSDYIVRIFGDVPYVEMAHRIDETGQRALQITEADRELIAYAVKTAQINVMNQFISKSSD